MNHTLLNCQEVRLYAEYKPTMGYINIQLYSQRLSENISLDSTVCVENDTITVEDVESNVAFKFKDIVFEPTTCRNLQYDKKGEVTLTVQVKRPSSETLTVVHRSHNQQEEFVREIKANQNNCFCQVCGAKILKDSCHFLRVMPLPSENWSDFSDMWFCHNHSHSNDSGQATNNPVSSDLKLRPKLKDCLVAETYFLVVSDQIKEGNIHSKEDVSVYCRRCRNLLGEVMPREKNGVSSSDWKVTKILRSSVLFHLDLKPNGPEREPVQHRGFEVEDMFASLLMDHSRMYTSFKLYVTSSTEGKPFHCLIWIIDPKLLIYKGSSHSTHEFLAPLTAVKVLFKALLEHDSKSEKEQKEWKKDNSIHITALPYASCLTLLQLLITNSKSLPIKCRKHEEFNVGYLKFQKKAATQC